jgi:hypothetical protein
VFAIAATIVGIKIPSQWGTKLEISLMAVGIGAIIVLVASLGYALLVAPYEQRNELRKLKVQSDAELEQLCNAPVDDVHAHKLRLIATNLQACLARGDLPAAYADESGQHPILRDIFGAHFPCETMSLGQWDLFFQQEADAWTALGASLQQSAVERFSAEDGWISENAVKASLGIARVGLSEGGQVTSTVRQGYNCLEAGINQSQFIEVCAVDMSVPNDVRPLVAVFQDWQAGLWDTEPIRVLRSLKNEKTEAQKSLQDALRVIVEARGYRRSDSCKGCVLR